MRRSNERHEETPEPAPDRDAERSLRIVIAASMLSKVADWQLGIVIPLAVLAQTGSMAIALVSFALRWVPYAASPVLGSLIDRFDKRTVFIVAQVVEGLCVVMVALLLTNRIAVSAALLASGFAAVAVSITSQFVLIPNLIEPARQAVAVARLSSAIELSKVGGLLFGGLLTATVGARFGTWVTAVLYFAAGSVAFLLPDIPSRGSPSRLLRDLALGFRWVGRPDIIWLVVTMTTANLAVGDLETVLVTLFGDQHIEPFLISVIIAMGLVMGAVGSRLCPHIFPGWSPERRILLFQVMALVSLGITALPHVVLTVAGFALISFSLGGSNVASITYRQMVIPVELAGRVNSSIRMFITGAIPLSAFLYAWATRFSGFRFWVLGLALAITAVLVWAGYTFRSERSVGLHVEGRHP